jgi:hypothetical protein
MIKDDMERINAPEACRLIGSLSVAALIVSVGAWRCSVVLAIFRSGSDLFAALLRRNSAHRAAAARSFLD